MPAPMGSHRSRSYRREPGRRTAFLSVSRSASGVIGFVDEVVLTDFMVANLPNPGVDLLPRNVRHSWLPADLLDDGIQGLRHLVVLGEQFLGLRTESRLFLQDLGHVPTLLLETEMIGQMRPHFSQAAAQLRSAFARRRTDGLVQFLEIAEERGVCVVEGVGKRSFWCVHGSGTPGGMRPPLAREELRA